MEKIVPKLMKDFAKELIVEANLLINKQKNRKIKRRKQMKCQKCGSDRVVSITAKCPDGFTVSTGDNVNFNSTDIENLCDGEYVDPDVCLDCGQVQGQFPVAFNGKLVTDERSPLPEDLCKSVDDWIAESKNHKCDKKDLIASDFPPSVIGCVCTGCGKYFGVKLSDVSKTIGSLDAETKKTFGSAVGRQNLAKSFN